MAVLTADRTTHHTSAIEPMTVVFRRAIARLIEAREHQAKRRVADHVASLDAASLKQIGFSPDELAELLSHRSR
ncbi:MAG: hypothetical protein GC150_04015 [Rhizobiales bacterium]|nr:hypothetical protein [Hyphomicrobiales bacterium]